MSARPNVYEGRDASWCAVQSLENRIRSDWGSGSLVRIQSSRPILAGSFRGDGLPLISGGPGHLANFLAEGVFPPLAGARARLQKFSDLSPDGVAAPPPARPPGPPPLSP